ncbi:hypothetical protein GCM10010495_48390 [Kitasatospora herbaricolor]|nr:hypothetical protein GCM10010495_48390 [Kitasatospora herbaricolor]
MVGRVRCDDSSVGGDVTAPWTVDDELRALIEPVFQPLPERLRVLDRWTTGCACRTSVGGARTVTQFGRMKMDPVLVVSVVQSAVSGSVGTRPSSRPRMR